MRKKYWRDVGFFALGTFFGGWVLSIILSIFKRIGG